MRTRYAWLLFCLLLTGCAGSQERALDRLDEIAGRVIRVPCHQPDYRYRQVENSHVAGLIDEIETLRCPGLELQTYLSREAARPDGMPVYLNVSRPHPALPAFLQPGSAGSDLERRIGRPASRTGARWYYGSDETTEKVTIEWQNGLINNLRWEWYFD
ncbi:hypothetical protein LL240_01230 [Oceanimonas baumannii]|uniref:hypothetical protein n=1 Tax=Oceanimonas baumannii TaxID=129578 RepID=UPI001D1978AE|nr:hypothetical protein [Oceanimonas baumannii]MCC4263083.1 hypothetical protein [Oceanimonas baumannii]